MTDNAERERGERRLAMLIEEDGPAWRERIARRESGDDEQAEAAERELSEEIASFGAERVEQRVFHVSAGVRLVVERRGAAGPPPHDWEETTAAIEHHPAPVDARWNPTSGWVRVPQLDDVALGMAGIMGFAPEWIEE